MPENPPTDRQIVDALLTLHGITPSEEEIAKLVDAYPATRAAVATLYTMQGVRYEEPAVTFDPRVEASA
jgi:hypothetical protein